MLQRHGKIFKVEHPGPARAATPDALHIPGAGSGSRAASTVGGQLSPDPVQAFRILTLGRGYSEGPRCQLRGLAEAPGAGEGGGQELKQLELLGVLLEGAKELECPFPRRDVDDPG